MARQLIAGPNFSGRSGALQARLGAGGSTFFIGPYAEAALSGLASTAADEIAIYRDEGASQRPAFRPLDLAIYADRRPQTLSGGEQVLLALQCFSQSPFRAIAIDTALEQLDGDNRVATLGFLSQHDASFDVAVIDNRLATAPPGWTTLTCRSEALELDCDLDGLMAGLAPPSAPRLDIRNLRFSYRKGADVFIGANLTLAPGRAYRLFGRNGAGKTTLLKILVGVLSPSGGQVFLDDAPYAPWRHGNTVFALATQNPDHQWCGATLREDIQRRRASLKANRNIDAISDEAVQAAALRLGLASLDQHLYELPLAMRKRLSWLWPFSGVMPWIMLDEPTVGQDRETSCALAAALSRFCALGHGVLFVTHDDDFAAQVPHQVVTIENRTISS